jgi:hypothetical protein
MRIEIYGEGQTEQVARLTLTQNGHEVQVTAVDANGEWLSYLLKITPRGVYLEPDVSPRLGLPLDEDGRILVIDDEY